MESIDKVRAYLDRIESAVQVDNYDLALEYLTEIDYNLTDLHAALMEKVD